MKILHLLSQFEVTGAETYAITLAHLQQAEGHEMYIISDTIHLPHTAVYISHPIGNRRFLQRIRNIFFLRSFIRKNNIDVVHAHSRAASWVAYFAVKGSKIPLVSTIHGRQHLHSSTQLFPHIYGDKVITICANLRDHLREEVGIPSERITVIPNGFDFGKNKLSIQPSSFFTLLLAGRTTGPKGELVAGIITKILPVLSERYPTLRVHIVGGYLNQLPIEAIHTIEEINKKYPDKIKWIGFSDQLLNELAQANLVIASGRIAIETLWMNIPLLALGESLYHGLVDEKNIEESINSNFGDIIARLPVPLVDYVQIQNDIEYVIQHPGFSFSFTEKIEKKYNVLEVAQQVMKVYQSGIFKKKKPKPIPVLMYHKVPLEPIESKHRIFIIQDDFEKHLRFLQKKKFTPITFKDYDAYRRGERSWLVFPKKPIFLTFDDAYLDNYTNAFSLLKKYNFKVTIFTLGDEQHQDNFWDVANGERSEPLMNTTQKLEMQMDGIEFGSHTLNHRDLTKLKEEEVVYELIQSKINLEKQLGTSVISFAYPYGTCNEKVKNLTREAGYRYAVAIDSGGMHLEDDPYQIFRVSMFPEDGIRQLRKKAAWWYRRYFKRKRGR